MKYTSGFKIASGILYFLMSCFSLLIAGEISLKHAVIDNNGPKDPWAKIIADIDKDGNPDIVIGGRTGPLVWYKYPAWSKTVITPGGYRTVDGEAGDVDGDGDLDIVMGGILWYENPMPFGDPATAPWMEHQVADHKTHDIELSDLDGDGDMDIVTRDQSAFSDPRGNEIHVWLQEDRSKWTNVLLNCPHGEGIILTDIDSDLDKDILIDGIWFENTKKMSGDSAWIEHKFTKWHHSAAVASADLNGDGRMDVVLAPSELKNQFFKISWFEGPKDPRTDKWQEHIIEKKVETVYHSLEIADINSDGFIDIVTAEMHQGEDPDEVLVYLNTDNGKGWEKKVISTKGSHLLQVGDLENDGDVDLLGANWSGDYQPIEVWFNESSNWTHLSSLTGDIPVPAVGRQVATIICDIDKDGIDDFVIPSYEKMVWFKRQQNGWKKFALENGSAGVRMEAGGDSYDIDGDGDLDVLMAAQSRIGEIWWWQNPYPDYFHGKPWKRHLVISVGGTHHDQIFGDFDSDGKIELAFWYNRGKTLYLAEIPKDPTQKWPFIGIATFEDENPRPEGLAKADIDLDGKVDIVGGGSWFKHLGGTSFEIHVIDPVYRFSRSVVGDFIRGGRPEVVIGSGDQTGPLNMYQWKNNVWKKHTLISFVDHGHTLRVGDIDGDGNDDIYAAEMYRPGPLEACRQWLLFGDGKGGFKTTVLSTGLGTHEGRLGDLDGDGDLDILQKDFQQHKRVDVWLNPAK